jgi:thiosulfate/3-mercaptopyruvate sulfurtransferase
MKRIIGLTIVSCAALILLCSTFASRSGANDFLPAVGEDEIASVSGAEGRGAAASAQFSKYFVTTAWVKAHRAQTVLIDTRAPAKYAAGHIKGAINVPSSNYFFDRIEGTVPTTIHYTIPTPTEFIDLVNEWGIKSTSTVVTYGEANDTDWGLSARLAWTLQLYGHKKAYNMDGGFPKWQYVDKYTKDTVTTPTLPTRNTKTYVLSGYSDILATRYDVLAVVNGDVTGTVILDARTPGEYAGTSTLSGNPRSGHVPGAIALNWTDVFMDNPAGIKDPSTQQVIKVLKSEAALRTLFEGLGVTTGKTVVPYCEGGFRSAHATFMLLGLGYPSVRHYQGSWSEWSRQDPTVYPAHAGTTP